MRMETDRRVGGLSELRELTAQLTPLEDALLQVEDQGARTRSCSLMAGMVHASTVQTLGAVLKLAATVQQVSADQG